MSSYGLHKKNNQNRMPISCTQNGITGIESYAKVPERCGLARTTSFNQSNIAKFLIVYIIFWIGIDVLLMVQEYLISMRPPQQQCGSLKEFLPP